MSPDRMSATSVAHKSTGGTLQSLPEPVDPVGDAPDYLTFKTVTPLRRTVLIFRRSLERSGWGWLKPSPRPTPTPDVVAHQVGSLPNLSSASVRKSPGPNVARCLFPALGDTRGAAMVVSLRLTGGVRGRMQRM